MASRAQRLSIPPIDHRSRFRGPAPLIGVMECVEVIGRDAFSFNDVCAFEGRLAEVYPGNNDIWSKNRQHFQVLRDQGVPSFIGRGRYRLTSTTT
jgi:hypothetical protein